MAYVLALILLAQQIADNRWIIFEACELDTSKWPHETRPMRDKETIPIFIGRRTELIIWPLPPGTVGIDCVKLGTPHGARFVVGTTEEIMRKIDGR